MEQSAILFPMPCVMGILNATPDSFFSGSRMQTENEIARRADEIIGQGGSIIDVGAFSTRPGADVVSEGEEMRRMRLALQTIRGGQPDAVLSIDTYRPSVARMAVEEFGAQIINDVSEGGVTGVVDTPLEPSAESVPAIFQEMARLQQSAGYSLHYVLMSVQPDYESTRKVFHEKTGILRQLGVNNIILDPGYGFGKDVISGNYSILAKQQLLKDEFQLPMLVGISRKRMIWQLSGTSPEEALNGTTVLNTLALERGADILRVHDVREAVECIRIHSLL